MSAGQAFGVLEAIRRVADGKKVQMRFRRGDGFWVPLVVDLSDLSGRQLVEWDNNNEFRLAPESHLDRLVSELTYSTASSDYRVGFADGATAAGQECRGLLLAAGLHAGAELINREFFGRRW